MRNGLCVAAAAMVLLHLPSAYGQTSAEERLKALEARVTALEKTVGDQAKCIQDQKLCIEDQKQKITGYETRFQEMDQNLNRQLAGPALLADSLRIGASATMIVQGTGNTNVDPKKQSRTDASYSADVTLEKEFKDLGSRAFIHLESGQGNGLEDNLTLYSNVNRDADNDNNVRLTEVWYEQGFSGERALLTFGKLDPTVYFDTNEAANDETTQFLGRMFRNSPVVEFPDNTGGIRLGVSPVEWLELEGGLFDADADFEELGGDLFTVGQVNFKPQLLGRGGNYRLLAWNNGADHTDWRDSGKNGENAYGYGLSFDQEVTDTVTAFARWGWQDPHVYNPNLTATNGANYSLEQAWSVGFQFGGKPWGREKDMAGVAVGQAIPSKDYKRSDSSLLARTESHLETYYNIRMNDHLSISPDFQYIWNPFGKDVADDTSNAAVYGVRAQIDF